MQRITSKDNSLIKHIKKLKDKKYRDISNEYIIEGIKLIDEAIKEHAKIKQMTEMIETIQMTESWKILVKML